MKSWLKQQTTEFTAWVGFFICASVFFVPDWATFLMGAFLIAIDDKKATAWVNSWAPWVSKKIDEATP